MPTVRSRVRSAGTGRHGPTTTGFFHGPPLRGLDVEARIRTGLAAMDDDQLDRICQTLAELDMAPFFTAEVPGLLRATASWTARSLPLILRDARLLTMLAGR